MLYKLCTIYQSISFFLLFLFLPHGASFDSLYLFHGWCSECMCKTSVLFPLHSFQIRHTISCKIRLLVYKVFNGKSPNHLFEYLSFESHPYAHNLRSTHEHVASKATSHIQKQKKLLDIALVMPIGLRRWNNLLHIRKYSIHSF